MKQKYDSKTFDLEDILIWPDSSWCYRYELSEMQHKSDDYQTLYFGTSEWDNFFERLDNALSQQTGSARYFRMGR